MGSRDPSIRLRAGVRFADVMRRTDTKKTDILDFLGYVIEDAKSNREVLDAGAIQAALIARARAYDRKPDRNLEKAGADLVAAAQFEPPGVNGAEALLLLARLHEWEGRLDSSRSFYSDLHRYRDSEGGNERLESGYYFGAHLEYWRDRQRALTLLEELVDMTANEPDSSFYTASRFWAGRIYRELGNEPKAVEVLNTLAAARPLDFYGLRARCTSMWVRMHPNSYF